MAPFGTDGFDGGSSPSLSLCPIGPGIWPLTIGPIAGPIGAGAEVAGARDALIDCV